MPDAEGPAGAERQSRVGAVLQAAGDALPSPSLVIFGSVAWGVVLAATAMMGMWLQNGLIVVNPLAISGVYFYGGSLGFAPAVWLGRMLFARRSLPLRFVGGTALIALSSHVAAAAIFALQYRVFYAHWHADFPDIIWFFQLAFTSAGAVYLFTVGSFADYWPFSILGFLAFGFWFATRGAAPRR
jgi:hypothetical protein